MCIRDRRYDFKRITIDTIAARLKELTDAEQIDVEERALRYVAKAADGSMRDALSLLDQCSAFHYGETLTYDNVLEVLGAVDTKMCIRDRCPDSRRASEKELSCSTMWFFWWLMDSWCILGGS